MYSNYGQALGVKVMLNNMMSRLNRIELLFNINVYEQWKKQVLKQTQLKTLSSIKSKKDIDIASKILAEIERKYGIHKINYRVKEIKKDINKRYIVNKYSKEQFKNWFKNKCIELDEICETKHSTSKDLLFNVFKRFIRRKCKTNIDGGYDENIDNIFNDDLLKNNLIYVTIACTIGLTLG